MDIKAVDSKLDTVMQLLGLKDVSYISEGQKLIIAKYLEEVTNPLIDAFIEAGVTNAFNFVVDDLDNNTSYKVTVKKIK